MVEAAQTHVHKFDTSVTRLYDRIAERRGKAECGGCSGSPVAVELLFGVKE